ncbi:MAG: hypothetical protein KJO77_01075, partial [Bacteroidia bacterium]|nr:hypothetical protein [Bacteroidia bacterium]
MKSIINKRVLAIICFGGLLASSCVKKHAFSAQDIKLNESVQERFRAGERSERDVFQFGQATDQALDVVVPIDPSRTKEIAKPHNYYLSRGSTIEFNIETLVKFSTYDIDDDLEERGELIIPS